MTLLQKETYPQGHPPDPVNPQPACTVRYCNAEHDRCELLQPSQISDVLHHSDAVLWVHVRDPGPAEFEILSEEFGFHGLALEDAAKQVQRPKIDEYQGYFFVVTYAPLDGEKAGKIETREVDLFIGRNYVVSVCRGEIPALEEAMRRWERTHADLRRHVGFLLHTILDSIIDAYFPLVDQLEDRVDEAELNLFSEREPTHPQELLNIKQSLFSLRKVIYPMREVFNTFLRNDSTLFTPDTRPYFQDVYDHILRLLDSVEVQRDAVGGALEAQLAIASNRLNETMKRLTVIAICVAIMSAVYGAWGMNFEHVPLDHMGLKGFAIVVGSTVTVVIGAIAWSRWRHLW